MSALERTGLVECGCDINILSMPRDSNKALEMEAAINDPKI